MVHTTHLLVAASIIIPAIAAPYPAVVPTTEILQERELQERSFKGAMRKIGHGINKAAQSPIAKAAGRVALTAALDARSADEGSMYTREFSDEEDLFQRLFTEDLDTREMDEDMYIRSDLFDSELDARGLSSKIGGKIKGAAKGVAKSVINNPSVRGAVKTAGKEIWGAAKSSMGQMATAKLKKHGLARRDNFEDSLDAREVEELENLYAREEDLYERDFLEDLEARNMDELD